MAKSTLEAEGVGHTPQLILVLSEPVLRPSQVFDVCIGAIPLDHVPAFIAHRLHAFQKPPVLAVESPQSHFELSRLSRRLNGKQPFLHDALQIVGMNDYFSTPSHTRLAARCPCSRAIVD